MNNYLWFSHTNFPQTLLWHWNTISMDVFRWVERAYRKQITEVAAIKHGTLSWLRSITRSNAASIEQVYFLQISPCTGKCNFTRTCPFPSIKLRHSTRLLFADTKTICNSLAHVTIPINVIYIFLLLLIFPVIWWRSAFFVLLVNQIHKIRFS